MNAVVSMQLHTGRVAVALRGTRQCAATLGDHLLFAAAATRKALERAQEEVEKDLEDLGWGDDEDAVAPGSEEDADAAFAPEETLPGELQATEGADANSDGVDAMPVSGATEGADGAAAGPCPAQPAEDQATTVAASTPAAAALSDAAAEDVTGQADDLAGSVGGDVAPLPAAAPAAADHQPS